MTYIEKCWHDLESVMEIEGVNYHGASKKAALAFVGDLMINFTRISDIPSAAKVPQLSQHIDLGFSEEIMVSWPDFGVPSVKPSFWKALHGYIKQNNWEAVCFHCEAGHGRTGTALACMLVAIQGYTPEEAVWHVRTHHCIEAVESSEQCSYLQKIDAYYNDRELNEDELAVPSMVFQRQQMSDDRE